MPLHPFAGKPAPKELLIDAPALIRAYSERQPDWREPGQRVAFGTSGHRGTSLDGSFNRAHILAVSQAVCEYREKEGITGPLFFGIDTHALSRPALETALEVFVANRTEVYIDRDNGFTPTPVISHAILTHNRAADARRLADGVVITPSHNPPQDGGFKYNPPNGGPAGTEITGWIEGRANELLREELRGVKSVSLEKALQAPNLHRHDFITPYVQDLRNVIDMDAIRDAGIRIGVDPLGGSSFAYWEPIARTYGLKLEVVNPSIDPTFGFMCVDKDGKIRMDCSSPYAMASLIGLKDRYDIAFGNDPDSDRHGIVTPSAGLLNPNHYLAVAISYLFSNRPGWKSSARVGKTLVSSAMIDRVAAKLGRNLSEVPVGFKWFVDGLLSGDYGFGGEESAGASFLRKDGTTWTTDKDGIILCLLAAEITARTSRDPGQHYRELTREFGDPVYERLDAPADARSREILRKLSPDDVKASTLAGEPILQKLTRAPGNGASIGGLKVVARNGWFAARPSGTENIYKIYTESFLGKEHLARIQQEAQAMVQAVFERT
ncbi:MAG: phosphoglucomutase (alpha-D-glucose-1,6-bisphosphate-dependent) [Oligoflexia bacterium]|nr:phosphoglucomutase (alpha-D-glucose-1,6-bisphosphate-dependent) [Oligoflexia bacterium]